MIIEKKPITLAEVVDLVGDGERAEKIKLFSKNFIKLDAKKSKELKEGLKELDILKLNEEGITNLVNFMPQDAQDIMKVLEGISLDQEEIDKILGVLKK